MADIAVSAAAAIVSSLSGAPTSTSAALGTGSGAVATAPSVTRRLVEEFTRRPAPVPRPPEPEPLPAARPVSAGQAAVSPPAVSLDAITGREREVLALIATGLSNSEIAVRLSISEATAKTHVGHLLTKLAARDRVHLVIFAYELGLVPERR